MSKANEDAALLPFEEIHKKMIGLLKSNGGNVSDACEKLKISRQTHYNWIDRVDTYKKEVDDVNEAVLDFAESQLILNIKAGKEASLIFLLKCKGKKRGYIEKTEHDINVFRTANLTEQERKAADKILDAITSGNIDG